MKGFMESFNHPFGKEACKKRLLEEYKKYGKLIVAFDYDNTIFDYHNNGGDYSCVVNLLRHCTMLGFEMILFSTEEDEDKIIEKQVECVQMRVGNLINDMIIPPFTSSRLFPNSKKPYYNILPDDRAGLEESYEILKYVVDEIIKLN